MVTDETRNYLGDRIVRLDTRISKQMKEREWRLKKIRTLAGEVRVFNESMTQLKKVKQDLLKVLGKENWNV